MLIWEVTQGTMRRLYNIAMTSSYSIKYCENNVLLLLQLSQTLSGDVYKV